MIAYTRRQIQASGLPYREFNGEHQHGETFGERLRHAFEAVFAEGFTNVIAIGNDCPALDARLLNEAAARLQTTPLAIGPADDGGTYLLGLSRQAFNRLTFSALPWNTGRLLAAIKQQAQAQRLRVTSLRELHDIDNSCDFYRHVVQNRALNTWLYQVLCALVLTHHPALLCACSAWGIPVALKGIPRRGPPHQ